jgi:replicative DNA helicase
MAEKPKIQDSSRFKNATKGMVTQNVLDHGKLPPQAVDLEEAVLGALMLEEDALTQIIDIIKPETFYKDAHQLIFKAIQELFKRSEAIDILTVTNELKSTGELDQVGGPFYITQLTNRIASAANIEYHARILSQKFIQRQLIGISSEIIRDAFEDSTDVFDLLDKAETNLYNLSESNLRREFRKIKDLMNEAIHEIEASRGHAEGIRGVPSGFTELDRVTSGWQKSDLIVLASRPGMGKTAFALTIARNVAVAFKRPVVIFSLEMSSIQLVTRLISSETQLPVEKLRRGNLEDYEWEQLNAKIGNLVESPLFINDTPALSIFELRAQCRRLKEQHNIELIIIDYLQLMSSPTEGRGNREQEISNISRSLKALAKELNVPIIALSQLSRAVETRGGTKKPILSDLRESGAIEQDADIVLFIYRPEYYGINQDSEGNPTQGLAELSIAKHRNGALKDINLRFISRYAKFIEYLPADTDVTVPAREEIQFEESRNSYTRPSKMNELEDEDAPF